MANPLVTGAGSSSTIASILQNVGAAGQALGQLDPTQVTQRAEQLRVLADGFDALRGLAAAQGVSLPDLSAEAVRAVGAVARALDNPALIDIRAGARTINDVMVVLDWAKNNVPEGTFARLGQSIDVLRSLASTDVRQAGEARGTDLDWLVGLVPADIGTAGQQVDAFLRTYDPGRFRASLQQLAPIFDAVQESQRAAIADVIGGLPPEAQQAAAEASLEYTASLAMLGVESALADEFSLRTNIEFVQQTLLMMAVVGQVGGAAPVELLEQLSTLQVELERLRARVSPEAFEQRRQSIESAYLARLDQIPGAQGETLRVVGRRTIEDTTATFNMVMGFLKIIGASKNTGMPAEQRTAAIQSAAEKLDVVLLKGLQTAASSDLIEKLTPGQTPEQRAPVVRAFANLKRAMTPMPIEEAKRRITEDFGSFPFTSFGPVIGAASMATIYYATAKDPDTGEELRLAVKVGRDVSASFERTSRLSKGWIAMASVIAQSFEAANPKVQLSPAIQAFGQSIEGVLSSFRTEADLVKERESTAQAERATAANPAVLVAQVYPKLSGNKFFTMSYLPSMSVGAFVERQAVSASVGNDEAALQKITGRRNGRIEDSTGNHTQARAYAIELAKLFWGLEPTGFVSFAPRRSLKPGEATQYEVEFSFDSKDLPTAAILFDATGLWSVPEGYPVPHFAGDRSQHLEETFLATVVDLLIRNGVLHGDFQEGNVGVTIDRRGEPHLVFYDWGLTLHLNWKEKGGLMNLVTAKAKAVKSGDATDLAKALLNMAFLERTATLPAEAQQAMVSQMAAVLKPALPGADIVDAQFVEAFKVLVGQGIPVSEKTIQMTKTAGAAQLQIVQAFRKVPNLLRTGTQAVTGLITQTLAAPFTALTVERKRALIKDLPVPTTLRDANPRVAGS